MATGDTGDPYFIGTSEVFNITPVTCNLNYHMEKWYIQIYVEHGWHSITVEEPKNITYEDWTKLIEGDHKIYFDNGVTIQTGDNLVRFYDAQGNLCLYTGKHKEICDSFRKIRDEHSQ